jgi:hypothetical protein
MMPEEKIHENGPLWYRKVDEKRRLVGMSGNLTLLVRPWIITDEPTGATAGASLAVRYRQE